MPRPCKPRRIGCRPEAVYFKPKGVPLRQLAEVELAHDELEALRLADLEGLAHEEVGQQMEVSRATAGRILASARRKVAQALTQGLAIRIDTIAAAEPAGEQSRSEEMPGFDRTGPQGEGPLTGRRRGHCARDEKDQSQDEQPGRGPGGRGRGPGRGPGRGRGAGRGPGPGAGRGRGRGRGGRGGR
jgi:predicted DNA-binding protein (UPF0251 family)